MPNNVLNQLKSLRDGVAEELRRDPRYQTLQSLDKSIAEITNVLAAAGLLPAAKPAPSLSARLNGLGPAGEVPGDLTAPTQQQIAPPPLPGSDPAPPMAAAPFPAAPAPIPPSPAPHAAAVVPAATETTKPGFKDGTVSLDPAAVPKKKKISSLIKPAAGIAAALIAGGVVAELMHEHAEAKTAKGHVPTEPVGEEKEPEAEDASEPEAANEDAAADDAAPSAEFDEEPRKHGRAPGHAGETEAAADAHAPGPETGADEQAGAEPGSEASEDEAAVVPKGKAAGYVPMAAKAGAPQYAPSIAVKFGKLPNKVDLRPLMTPVEDQGETSSCVANAVAGAYEYWIKKASKKDQNISRLFVYYNARWRDGSQDKDGGSVIQLAMEGLQKFGACTETVWPFDPRLVLKKPGAEAYQDGAPYRVHDMAQVPLKLEAWKQALAEGKPIVFGIELFDSFDECSKRGGVVPMPAPDDLARKKHSGHSMCAVGYSDSEKVFIVRNSWGTGFGDKGYCYMPYDYLLNPKFNDADCWVFVPKVPLQPPRETWLDDTTPVTNSGRGVDFVIQPYKVDDYKHVAIDLFEHVRRPWNGTIVAEYAEYVSAVSRSVFSELSSFDVRTFLTSTAILAGVGVSALAISESMSTTSSESLLETESSSETEEDVEEDDADEDADDDAEEADDDAAEETEDDADEDSDDADEDASDEEDESDDGEEGAEDADDGEDDAESDDDAEEDDADAEDDADEDAGDDAEDEAEDDADDSEEGDSEEEDADEDEADDEDGDDENGDDEGGDEEGGDDDSGGDDSGGDDGDN